MALTQFEDSPSTNTPISSSNLNHNFNELAGEILWENSNPNQPYSPTTIAIQNKSEYKWFEVVSKNYYLDGYVNTSYTKFENGYNGYLMEIDTEGSLITRRVVDASAGLSFDDAYYKNYASTSRAVVDNNRAIPLKIIGYKN